MKKWIVLTLSVAAMTACADRRLPTEAPDAVVQSTGGAQLDLAPGAHAIVIDDFLTGLSGQGDIEVGPDRGRTSASGSYAGSGIMGGARDIWIHDVSAHYPQGYRDGFYYAWVGRGTFPADGLHSYATNGISGRVQVKYDGQVGTPVDLDPMGLGGVDLTGGGINEEFDLHAGVNGFGVSLVLTVYSDATHYSTVDVGLPFVQNLGSWGDIRVPFSRLAIGAGAAGPADLTRAGAVVLSWSNTSSKSVALLQTVSAPPTIKAAATTSGAAYAPGTWAREDVTVAFTCDDHEGSGVATVSEPVIVSEEGQDLSATGTCADNVGNTSNATFARINIDRTAPTITASGATATGHVADGGWASGNVTVSFTCDDGAEGSGVASVSNPVTIKGEGAGKTAVGTCTDVAGNVATTTFTVGIQTTLPVITATATADGHPYTFGSWTSTPVTVTFACSSPSGIQSLTEPVVVSEEGRDQTVTGMCTDNAGLTTPMFAGRINIDRTAPNVIPRAIANGRTYTPGTWAGSVLVVFQCMETLSGTATTAKPVTLWQDGADQVATGTCVDRAGNSTTATLSNIDIDATAPTMSADATTGGMPYEIGTWTRQSVVVTFTCQDALSGMTAQPAPITMSAEGANQLSPVVQCADRAGNSVAGQVPGISIDRTAPQIAFQGSGGVFDMMQTVQITCSATDAISGIATQQCPTISGPAYLLGGGLHQVTASAMDRAGNTATASASYTVRVSFDGLCALTQRLVDKAGIAHALCAKLSTAQAAAARGNAGAKSGALGAFANQLRAQSGKSISASDATLIERLLAGL
jgi:hypothetical protein